MWAGTTLIIVNEVHKVSKNWNIWRLKPELFVCECHEIENNEKKNLFKTGNFALKSAMTGVGVKFRSVLVNLFQNRSHFQLLLKSLYTLVFTTQYNEIASMLME